MLEYLWYVWQGLKYLLTTSCEEYHESEPNHYNR